MRKLLALSLNFLICMSLTVGITACDSEYERNKESAGVGSSVTDSSITASYSESKAQSSFSASSYTESDKEAMIVGVWKCDRRLADSLTGDQAVLAEYFGDLSIEVVMTFNSDGTAEMEVPEDSYEKYIQEYVRIYKEHPIEILENTLASAGMSLEEYLSLLGMTEQEFVDEILKDITPEKITEQMSGELEKKGKYKFEDDKLYFTDQEEYTEDDGIKYELTENTLTLFDDQTTMVFTKTK